MLSAVNDNLNVPFNGSAQINVLTNDLFASGFKSLELIDDTEIAASLTAMDSIVTYTAMADSCGSDEFRYILCDNSNNCDTATVFVNIECPKIYELLTIAAATADQDQDFVADRDDDIVEVRGVVTSGNFSGGSSVNFYLQDPTGGMRHLYLHY